MGIFEPIPFKGDENMLVDQTSRPVFDEDEGEKQLYINPDGAATDKATAREARQKQEKENEKMSNMLDLDDLLSGGNSGQPS